MCKYAIVGTGAIGGYCAVKMYLSKLNPHCLFRSDYQKVKEQGLTLFSKNKTIYAPVKAYDTIDDMPICDVIFIALKTTQNEFLDHHLHKIMHEKTILVFLQNGVNVEAKYAEYFKTHPIIGASCLMVATKIKAAVIQHYGLNTIEIAEYSRKTDLRISENLKIVAKILETADIQTLISNDLDALKWKKLALNIPINELSVLFDLSMPELFSNLYSYQIFCDVAKEVIHAAQQCHINLSNAVYEEYLIFAEKIKKMPKVYCSMKCDFDRHKPMELETIYYNALEFCKSKQVSMPMTQMLYNQLLFLEAKR